MEELKPRKAPPPVTTGQAVFLLGVLALVLVAVLGRYHSHRDGWDGASWRLDRWTGEMVMCGISAGNPPICRKFPRPS